MPYPTSTVVSLSEVKTYGQYPVINSLTVGNVYMTNTIDIGGTTILRNGNAAGGNALAQIKLGFNGGTDYAHSIRTQHTDSQNSYNSIDLYLWQTSDVFSTLGTKLGLCISNQGIGLGTNNPSYPVHLTGAGVNSLLIANTTIGSEVSIKHYVNGTTYDWYIGTNVGGIGAGSFGFYISSSPGTVMTVNTAGNFGIGYTNPNVRLRTPNIGINYGSFITVNPEVTGWPTNLLIGTELNSQGLTGDVTSIYTPGSKSNAVRLAFSSSGIIYCNARLGINMTSGISNYQLDVNGDSICDDWFRTRNNNGWYSETNGGGWYMSDTSWIRLYSFLFRFGILNEAPGVNAGNGNISTSRIGQGTASPEFPVDVREGVRRLGGSTNYRYLNISGVGIVTDNTMTYGLNANGRIFCTEINATSDSRIKDNIIDINDGDALNIIRQIQPKKYSYIDTILRGTTSVWGFLAQQVESILPYSVGKSQEYIPDIYDLADVTKNTDGKYVITLKNTNTIGLTTTDSSSQVSLKLYVDDKNTIKHATIKEIIDNNSFIINEDISIHQDSDPSNTQTQETIDITKVFVYGKQVNDFRTLNKQAIFTMATAALQEIDRQLQQTKQDLLDSENIIQQQNIEITQLENELNIILQQITV